MAPHLRRTPHTPLNRVIKFVCLAFQRFDWETGGIFLWLLGIKGNPVKEGFGITVWAAMFVADFFHRLLIDVRPHHLLCDTLVVRRARDHSPAPKLREPPDGVLRLRVIAIPLVENHVMIILFGPTITEVIISKQPSQDDFFRAIDVS